MRARCGGRCFSLSPMGLPLCRPARFVMPSSIQCTSRHRGRGADFLGTNGTTLCYTCHNLRIRGLMRQPRVCIYGGTNLQSQAQALISAIAYKLIQRMSAVIVTGGFLRSRQEPDAVSTDFAALKGAQSYAEDHAQDLHECFEAWIPEPVLDKRSDLKPVRMSEKTGITVHVASGRTPLGRRLSMVAGVDMVVTISGKKHTEVVVEQALELGIPVLPIPNPV